MAAPPSSTDQIPSQSPDRIEWSTFSQAMCQLLRGSLSSHQNGTLCESTVLRKLRSLRQQVEFEGRTYTSRMIVRAFEDAPADAAIILIDAELDGVPPEEDSDYELWKWARSRPKGVRFIPIDIKFQNVTIGREIRATNSHFYGWTNNVTYRDRVAESEAVFAMVEGQKDHIAIVPTKTWVDSTSLSAYGIETLSGGCPLWLPLFMVHVNDLAEAVRRVVRAALYEPGDSRHEPYINPSTEIKLSGWLPGARTKPSLDPASTNPTSHSSFKGTTDVWDAMSAAGGTVEFNPAMPDICDFHLSLDGGAIGPLRVEGKDYESLDALIHIETVRPRSAPLAARRLWHVLYVNTRKEKIICITRDEVAALNGLPPDKSFIQAHTFEDFQHASAHIKTHASAAVRASNRALRDVRPEDICLDLARRNIDLDAGHGIDPLQGRSKSQLTLPWVSRMMNFQCMKLGFGVCLPLGIGHPLGTHVFVAYEWTPQDVRHYVAHGSLPFALFTAGVSKMRCLVLRFQDNSTFANLKPIDEHLAVRKAQYHRTVRDAHCFLLGSILNPKLHQTATHRNSNYLLLPSEFTILTSNSYPLEQPSLDAKEKGGHFFRRVKNTDTQIPRPSWGTAAHASYGKILVDKTINPLRYVMNLVDGEINRQISQILCCDGETSISSSEFPQGNRNFDATKYHLTVKQVLQMAWDYGYKRMPLKDDDDDWSAE